MADPYLDIVSGPRQGERVVLPERLTIGRHPDNGLQLNDMQISRQHAVIERAPGGAVLRDLGSGNGTFVAGQRVLERQLRDGDVIQVGPAGLRYHGQGRKPETTVRESEGVRMDPEPAESQVHSHRADNVYQTFFQAARGGEGAARLAEAQGRLAAVYEANQVFAKERDPERLFGRVLEQIFSLVPAHNGVILLWDEAAGELTPRHKRTAAGEIRISRNIVRRVFEGREAVITFNAPEDSRFSQGASIIAQRITSAMCAPLVYQDECLGVLYVDARDVESAFTRGDLELLVTLAAPAAIAIKNAEYVGRIEGAYRDTITVLARAIELRDHYTVGHTARVTNFALAMARALDWSEEKLAEVSMGGTLHDIGKIAVDNAILGKKERLTADEFDKMKVHPERGAELLRDCEYTVPLVPYALYHHERYDGKGYPFGLEGEGIPIEGRLIAVADTFDAMTSNRPYRKGLEPEEALRRLQEAAGTQFDPVCVDALVRCYRDGRIDGILQDYHKRDKRAIACAFCSTYIPLPEDVEPGDVFPCRVCHRRLRLKQENEVLFGELLAAGEDPPAAGGSRQSDWTPPTV